jgi:hypothetical protein
MKILRKLCSEQVQILLERMDNHWTEEFAFDGSKWEPMLPHGGAFEQFTRIEQRCIRKTAQEQTTKLKKEKAYSGILERTMSTAKTRWDYDDERHGRTATAEKLAMKPSKVLTTAALQQQAQSLLEKEYAKAYGQAAVDRQRQQAEALGNYMQNVQFEMGRANSLDEVRAIAEKYNHYMELEKAAIEHQQYLKQHAPRGYL